MTQTAKLSFVIDQPAQPGTYVVGCTPLTQTKQVTTTFIVTEENAPTQPPEAPPQEQPKPPTITLTGGTITYDEASEQLSPHKDEFGYFPSQHHKWCAPTLTIASDGTINGTCSQSGDPTGYGDWFGGSSIEGTIIGTALPGGDFTFEETLTERYKPDDPNWWYTRTTVIKGKGSFVSATQASGSATFTAECQAGLPEPGYCGVESASDSFTGTINWEFNGTGVTSEADSVSSLRPQEKGRVVSVYEMAATIPMRGLVSDMLKKYLDLIFKP